MKKLNIYLLSVVILLLAACGNSEEPSTEEVTVTEGEDNSELTELEEENKELRRQLEEQDDEDENEEVAVEETSEDDTNSEIGGSEDTQSSREVDNQDDNTEGDHSDLVFDINSPEVQAYINKNDNYDDEGNFVQDAIAVGMTQSEIETLYGIHDYIIPSPSTESAAIYENIAVVYEERGPYVAGTDSNIDPDDNKANRVLYFVNLTVDEVLNTMGTPDEQVTNLMGTQNYIYEGDSSNEEWGTIILSEHETPEGLRIGSLSVSEEELVSNDDSNSSTLNEEDIPTTDDPNPNADIKDESEYEYLLTEYLHRLTAHYNMVEYDDVYYYLKRGSPAYDKIADNKASGHFTGHETYDVELVSMTDLGDGTVRLNANRVYSHDSSDGQRIANVNYIVNAETHEIIDFEGISDNSY